MALVMPIKAVIVLIAVICNLSILLASSIRPRQYQDSAFGTSGRIQTTPGMHESNTANSVPPRSSQYTENQDNNFKTEGYHNGPIRRKPYLLFPYIDPLDPNIPCPGCKVWSPEAPVKKRTNLLILPLAAAILFLVLIVGRCIRWCHEDIELHDAKVEAEEMEQAVAMSRHSSLSSSKNEPLVPEPMLQQVLRKNSRRRKSSSSRRSSIQSEKGQITEVPAPPPTDKRLKIPPVLGAGASIRETACSRKGSSAGSESWSRPGLASRTGSRTSMSSVAPTITHSHVNPQDISSPSSSLGYGSGQGSTLEINQVPPFPVNQQAPQHAFKPTSNSDLNLARALLQLQGICARLAIDSDGHPISTSIDNIAVQTTPSNNIVDQTHSVTGINSMAVGVSQPSTPQNSLPLRCPLLAARSLSYAGRLSQRRYSMQISMEEPVEMEQNFVSGQDRTRSTGQKHDGDNEVFLDDASSAYSSFNSVDGQEFLNSLRLSHRSLSPCSSLGDSEVQRRRLQEAKSRPAGLSFDADGRRPSTKRRALVHQGGSGDVCVAETSSRGRGQRFLVTKYNSLDLSASTPEHSFAQFRFMKPAPVNKSGEVEKKQAVPRKTAGRISKSSTGGRWKARLVNPVILEALNPDTVRCKQSRRKRVFSDPGQ